MKKYGLLYKRNTRTWISPVQIMYAKQNIFVNINFNHIILCVGIHRNEDVAVMQKQ